MAAGLGHGLAPLLPRVPWAAGALAGAALLAAALLAGLVRDVVRLRRVKRDALPLGVVRTRSARVGTSASVATPTAIGYLHPAVVVPAGFRARVDEGEWEAILAHECAHLARRDDWAKAIQSACARAAWWLPGLWILGRALDLERELASDERAAAEAGPRRYAACLLRLATHRCEDALAPALWGRRSHVAIRVERLVRPSAGAGPLVRAAALGAFTAVGAAGLIAGALTVPVPLPPDAPAAAHAPPAAYRVAAAARPRRVVLAWTAPPRRAAAPAAKRRPCPVVPRAAGIARAAAPAHAAVAAALVAARPRAVAARAPRRTALVAHRVALAVRPPQHSAPAAAVAAVATVAAARVSPRPAAATLARAGSDDKRAGGGAPSPLPGAPAAEAIAPPDPAGGGAAGSFFSLPIFLSPGP